MPKGTQPKLTKPKKSRSSQPKTVASAARRAAKTQPKFGRKR